MDPFTQRIFEKAEQRSRTLGISKSAKFPLSDRDQTANRLSGSDQYETETKKSLEHEIVIEREQQMSSTNSPKKVTHSFSTDKENMDVGIEINITTGPNVEVQVEVDEREIDADGNEINRTNEQLEPSSAIRDCSRNRLQRLGALYSETDSLSSPIHRTEARFHEQIESPRSREDRQSRRPKHKFGKLVALADSINSWEDDTSHPDYKHSKISEKKHAETPKKSVRKEQDITNSQQREEKRNESESAKQDRRSANDVDSKQTKDVKENNTSKQTKQLSWDKSVMDSLEAQGFQRRESASTKFRYDYVEQRDVSPKKDAQTAKVPVCEPKIIKSVATSTVTTTTTTTTVTKAVDDRKISGIKSGLVSGRAAEFENKAVSSPGKQKDPAEMSLKERMMFFEKKKGAALIPKAAFGMAAPVAANKPKDEKKKIDNTRTKVQPELPRDFPSVDVKIREKVAALKACSGTISENKIKADLEKQKQSDMDVLINRFNKQKKIIHSETRESDQPKGVMKAPPPPPPPQKLTPKKDEHVEAKCMITNKRRSPGQRVDGSEVPSSSDDTKRVKVTSSNKANRLYPVLSDIETSESENDNCATTTASAYSSDNKCIDNEDDLDLDESVMESEDGDNDGICNVSLRREIMQVVRNNESQSSAQYRDKERKRVDSSGDIYYGDSSLNSAETSDYSGGVEDYLNEALDEDEEGEEEEESDSNNGYSESDRFHTNGTASSDSFCYRKQPKNYEKCRPIPELDDDSSCDYNNQRGPVKSSLEIDPSEDTGVVTLVHTVSFYRRQQSSNSNPSTPVRKVQWNQLPANYNSSSNNQMSSCNQSENESSSDQDDLYQVQEKIKKLLDEVCKQQQVIAQTSQALNLCAATIEFSGSTESVEGERHLLVATHRRQAALDEVQRLRIEGSLRPSGSPKEKGRLTVKEIIVPLKQDYIRKLSADTISGHHLVCLLKYNENVLATKTVPTLPGLLAVKFPDVLQLNNVYADFKMTLEIYGMTAQREVLPHEVKYHINMNKKSGGKISKSKKGTDSRLVMPMIQSPAGPNVVRTPALVHYGFAIFSLREIQRNTWTINQVSNVSPLEGTIHMKINCELSVSVEYKGFLTMFEDISGFGAWHRRWCQLNGHVLNYWKYPDDEKKKAPMGSIDLYTCCSKKITTAPRDVCARLNTFLLECQRPARESDIESLLIIPKGKITIVRYLLSADTKDEREEWCAYFNKALTLLRAWGNPQ